MSRAKIHHIVLNSLVASGLPSLAWTYLSWRHKLGVGTIYVWPWVFIVTVWYGYRAQKLGLYKPLGIVAYDFRSIRVVCLPFLGAVFLPLLNFAINPQAPGKSLAVVIVVSGASWYLYNLVAIFARHVLKVPQ